MSLFSVRNRRNKNSHKRLLIVTACMTMLCLSACSQRSEEVSITETSSVKVESTADFSVEKDIRVIELEDNDSGVSNPQKNFKEQFSENELAILPSSYLLGGPDLEAHEKEYYGDNYELHIEYQNTIHITEDLYNRMKKAGLTGIQYDKDNDGLSDEEEIDVYHTDPNKISTSGDLYSDYYKVKNALDVNKQYEQKWVDVDENLSVLSEVIIDDKLSYPGITENYYNLQGVTQFDVGMYFQGDVKLKVNIDNVKTEDLVVEVYNVWTGEHSVIESSVEGDRLCFHVNRGYDKYLIHDKDMEVVIE